MASPVTPRHITDWILQIIVFLTAMTVFYYLDASMLARYQGALYGAEGLTGRDGAVLPYLLTQTFLIFIIQACSRTLTDRELRLKEAISHLAPWRMAQTAAVAAYLTTGIVWFSLAQPSGVNPGFLAIVSLGVLSSLVWPAIMRGMDSGSRNFVAFQEVEGSEIGTDSVGQDPEK